MEQRSMQGVLEVGFRSKSLFRRLNAPQPLLADCGGL